MCHCMSWLGAWNQFSTNSNPSQKVTQKVKTVRCLFVIELIDGTFIHLISEVLSPTSNTLSVSLFKSTSSIWPFAPQITPQKPNKLNEKKPHYFFPLGLVKMSYFTLVIWWKKIGFTLASAANTQLPISPTTSKHTFEFTYNYFPCNLQRYSYTNHRWKWIILSVRSLNGFERKVVVIVIELEFFYQTRTLVFSFKNVHMLIFLTRSLIDRWEILVKIIF